MELLTVEEAAQAIGIKVASVYHRIHTRSLSAVVSAKPDKRQKWLIDKAVVDEIVAAKKRVCAQSEYARQKGISRQAVCQLIARGKIKTLTVDGRKMVIMDA